MGETLMSFRLSRSQTPEQFLRATASSQFARIRVVMDRQCEQETDRQTLVDDVHFVRRRLKRLRSLVRLIAPSAKERREADARLRDASRMLAALRDAHVCLETLDSVIALVPSEIQQSVNVWLRSEVDTISSSNNSLIDGDSGRLLWINVRKTLRRCSKMIRRWQIPGNDFAAFHEGLRSTYRQARSALSVAKRTNNAESWHEFRKYLKYHGTQLRMLAPICPPLLGAHQAVAIEVAESLGRDHDLAMLEAFLGRLREGQQGETCGEKNDQLDIIADVIKGQQALLRRKSSRSASLLLAESPKAFVSRLDAYWECWKQGKS